MDRLRGLGGVLKVAAVIAAVGAYARISDEIAAANGQMRLASRNQADLNKLQAASYQIAQKQGTAWGATGILVAKATKSARALGHDWERAAELGINAAAAVSAGIRVSGTSSSAASAGIMQLNQALASGVLRGDELNSVMENIPAVGDAIARAMGKSAGQLRAMGKEGELTSKAVIEALEKARPELEKLAALIPLTFSAAFQKVANSFGQMITSLDKEGVGVGGALIASMNLLSSAMDGIAANADTISNIVIGVLVGAFVRAAMASTAAGVAALGQAKANHQLALSSVAVAVAQQRQAVTSLAVATAMHAQGAATRAQVANAAAAVVQANAAIAGTRASATAAGAAVAAAAGRVSLFGRAAAGAASVARVAFAAIGGMPGIVIAALASMIIWAGKAAASFQPIAGEAGTVADYIAVVWEDMSGWLVKAAKDVWEGWKEGLSAIAGLVRPVAVFIIDVFLGVARGVAGVVAGIVEAWRAGAANIANVVRGIAIDGSRLAQGPMGLGQIMAQGSATSAALAQGENLGTAFQRGWRSGTSSLGTATGESIVAGVEGFIQDIPDRISRWAKSSGYRERANQRAIDRARAANTGGDQGPGKPVDPKAKEDKAKKPKKDQDERTFQDILDEAKEQARLAGLTTNEAEKQSAIYQAQKELKRDLTTAEVGLLTAVIQQKQNNAANLALVEATRDAIQEAADARMSAAAEEARMAGNYGAAVQLEAELRVQQMVNQAKRDGVVLDAAKVEAYRRAVTLAAQETEIIKLQTEAKRALQEIADNARKAMQSAVSDGIYAALNGDIKGIGGFFKTIGGIIRRQIAESITHSLFAGDQQAKIDSIRVTQAAVSIAEPAALGVAQAGGNIVAAMNGAAQAIATGSSEAISDAAQVGEEIVVTGTRPVRTALDNLTGVFSGAAGPLAQAIQHIIGVFTGGGGGGGRGGGFAGSIGRFLGPGGPLSRGLDTIAGRLGIKVTEAESSAASAAGRAVPTAGGKLLGKLGTGAMIGQLTAGIPGIFGAKTSQMGGTLGGMAGSLIGGPLGAAIGGALGSAVGGLFKKTKTGSVGITSGGVGAATGSSGAFREAATGAGGSVMDQLNKYAKALGTTIQGFGSIQVGQRDGKWRVNETGTSLKTKKGAKDFGDDAQAAIAYAVEAAIRRGAFNGLEAGVAAALRSGAASVEEAVDFLSVQKRIRRQAIGLVDPVRAAIMAIDEEFDAMREQYRRFGADMTDLEKVYLSEREKAMTQAAQDSLGPIRDFISELKGGTLGGASLTDQVREQDRLFAAIEAAQAAGKPVDYEQLNSVGRALIEASRELEGATPAFYAQVNRVMAVLEAAIAGGGASNVSLLPQPALREEVTDPIVGGLEGVSSTLDAGFENVVAALNAQSQAIVRGNTAIQQRLAAGGGSGTSRDAGFQVEDFR